MNGASHRTSASAYLSLQGSLATPRSPSAFWEGLRYRSTLSVYIRRDRVTFAPWLRSRSVDGCCTDGGAARWLTRMSTSSYLLKSPAACSINLQHPQHQRPGFGASSRYHLQALRIVVNVLMIWTSRCRAGRAADFLVSSSYPADAGHMWDNRPTRHTARCPKIVLPVRVILLSCR